jgi:hypothetical protein
MKPIDIRFPRITDLLSSRGLGSSLMLDIPNWELCDFVVRETWHHLYAGYFADRYIKFWQELERIPI